jgi:hypothetical protein
MESFSPRSLDGLLSQLSPPPPLSMPSLAVRNAIFIVDDFLELFNMPPQCRFRTLFYRLHDQVAKLDALFFNWISFALYEESNKNSTISLRLAKVTEIAGKFSNLFKDSKMKFPGKNKDEDCQYLSKLLEFAFGYIFMHAQSVLQYQYCLGTLPTLGIPYYGNIPPSTNYFNQQGLAAMERESNNLVLSILQNRSPLVAHGGTTDMKEVPHHSFSPCHANDGGGADVMETGSIEFCNNLNEASGVLNGRHRTKAVRQTMNFLKQSDTIKKAEELNTATKNMSVELAKMTVTESNSLVSSTNAVTVDEQIVVKADNSSISVESVDLVKANVSYNEKCEGYDEAISESGSAESSIVSSCVSKVRSMDTEDSEMKDSAMIDCVDDDVSKKRANDSVNDVDCPLRRRRQKVIDVVSDDGSKVRS